MNRLKIFMIIFCLAISVPMSYFILRSHQSLNQEELSELRFFADTLFDQMEDELVSLLQQEEGRAIDEYSFKSEKPDGTPKDQDQSHSIPFMVKESYILGYIQNNPDGSYQTPVLSDTKNVSLDMKDLITRLDTINQSFNQKKTQASEAQPPQPAKMIVTKSKEAIKAEPQATFEQKYLTTPRVSPQKSYLAKRTRRVEQIPTEQAMNIAQLPPEVLSEELSVEKKLSDTMAASDSVGSQSSVSVGRVWSAKLNQSPKTLQVEFDPMQSVFIDDDHMFVFRRIVLNDQIYRQGFILLLKPFLQHLTDTHFIHQPLARFTNLKLRVVDSGSELTTIESGVSTDHTSFIVERIFPRPFSFIQAALTCETIPRSTERNTLNGMILMAGLVFLIGLFAIYRSARTVIDLSERRATFVSSVTHELKTPLTNIRMYIEMLEQGIARTPEREASYFRILVSESARLSRLINNVLEFSKLEKKKRQADLQEGNLHDVFAEVKDIMHEKLSQEGFALKVIAEPELLLFYDREMMIQTLINLIENSIKFGRSEPQKEITLQLTSAENRALIRVSDTGPGIPKHALQKVFDDFYRVDDERVRNTRGTGIGLALVKKLISTMGGRVTAANNDGPGCTITIDLPAKQRG